MSDKPVLSRRDAIKVAVAAGVTLLVRAQLPGVAALQSVQPALLPTRLTTLLAHSASAKAIGGAYLLQYPQEANVDILLDQVATRIAVRDIGLFSPSDQQLREQLDGLIRSDFAADRIVKLRGWVLSATEARLCALAALL